MTKGKFNLRKLSQSSHIKLLSFYPVTASILILVFGIFFVFSIQPLQVPDEPAHFVRAYALSQGQITAYQTPKDRYGFIVPLNVDVFANSYLGFLTAQNYTQIRDEAKQVNQHFSKLPLPHISSKPKRAFDLENIAIYSPVAYIPQAVGLWVASLIHMSILSGFYMGRLANLIVYTILVLLAFYYLPRRAFAILFLLACLPEAIMEAASYSADGLTISLTFLFISLVAGTYVDKRLKDESSWRIKRFIAISAILILLGLCKQVYVVFGILALPILFKAFPAKKVSSVIALCVVGPGILAAALWNAAVSKIGLNYAVFLGFHTVHPSLQLRHIIDAPLSYIKVLVKTFAVDFYGLTQYMVSGFVGRLPGTGPFLPEWAIVATFMAMGLAVLKPDNKEKKEENSVSTRFIILTAIIGLIAALAVVTILYITFTPYRLPEIVGIQGRYFIPIAGVLLFLPLWSKIPKISLKEKNIKRIVAGVVILNLLLMSLANVISV